MGCDALPFPLCGAELDTSWHGDAQISQKNRIRNSLETYPLVEPLQDLALVRHGLERRSQLADLRVELEYRLCE